MLKAIFSIADKLIPSEKGKKHGLVKRIVSQEALLKKLKRGKQINWDHGKIDEVKGSIKRLKKRLQVYE